MKKEALKHKTIDVSIKSTYSISGTLTIPEHDNNEIAILIISGSGKCDRDGNIGSLKLGIYKMLSDFLNSNGFTTLRYDKRGVNNSLGDYYETGMNDLISDASNALSFLKNNDYITPKKIVLIGHSEGAFIAPAIYCNNNYDGCILLCGTSSPGKELMPRPEKKIISEIKSWPGFAGKILRFLKADKIFQLLWNHIIKKSFSTEKAMIRILGLVKFNAKWLRESYEFDVRNYLETIESPALIIGGDKDIQSDPAETSSICKLIPAKTEGKIIPNMNHILCHSEERQKMLTCFNEYKNCAKRGLHTELKTSIVSWLNSNISGKLSI